MQITEPHKCLAISLSSVLFVLFFFHHNEVQFTKQ